MKVREVQRRTGLSLRDLSRETCISYPVLAMWSRDGMPKRNTHNVKRWRKYVRSLGREEEVVTPVISFPEIRASGVMEMPWVPGVIGGIVGAAVFAVAMGVIK